MSFCTLTFLFTFRFVRRVGTFYTPRAQTEHASYNLATRKEFDLFANVVYLRTMAGIPTRHSLPLDCVLIRENTQGEYAQLEHSPVPGLVESLKVVTRDASERLVRFALDWAVRHGRKKVTCVHKANIMKLTDGCFLRAFRHISQSEYSQSGMEFQEMIVDNASMQMVMRPHQFDVIVTSNLYGNILSNIGAACVGSPGISPGYSIGDGFVTFEPGARHIAEDIAGQNTANPTAMLLSSVLMLRHLGLRGMADVVERAVVETHQAGIHTAEIVKDNPSPVSTSQFTDAVIARLQT